MGVLPPVCMAMSADGLRLAFVLVCVYSIVLKVYSPCGLYVQNLTGAQTCKKHTYAFGAFKRGFALRGGQVDTQTAHRRNGLLTHKLSKTHQLLSASTRKPISLKS